MDAKLRFSTQPPKDLQELHRRLAELLPQLEHKFIEDVEVGTEETPIAHGLNYTPSHAIPLPHCLALVCETKRPTKEHVFLRATNKCVVTVEIIP
jgi:hypothetical protein